VKPTIDGNFDFRTLQWELEAARQSVEDAAHP